LGRGWSSVIKGSLAGNRGGDNAEHDAFEGSDNDVDDVGKMMTSYCDLQVYHISRQSQACPLPYWKGFAQKKTSTKKSKTNVTVISRQYTNTSA